MSKKGYSRDPIHRKRDSPPSLQIKRGRGGEGRGTKGEGGEGGGGGRGLPISYDHAPQNCPSPKKIHIRIRTFLKIHTVATVVYNKEIIQVFKNHKV